jgi:hypothetical protein
VTGRGDCGAADTVRDRLLAGDAGRQNTLVGRDTVCSGVLGAGAAKVLHSSLQRRKIGAWVTTPGRTRTFLVGLDAVKATLSPMH